MRYLICSILLFITQLSFAQSAATRDTIVAVFHQDNNHKDGYEIGGCIVDFPAALVKRCSGKKIRLAGQTVNHSVTEEDLKVRNEKGEVIAMKQGRASDYCTFTIYTVSLWDKKGWKTIYTAP